MGRLLELDRARDRMVDVQVARRGVRDRRVPDAMRRVPRDAFVEPGFEESAYEDGPLPISEGQTISQRARGVDHLVRVRTGEVGAMGAPAPAVDDRRRVSGTTNLCTTGSRRVATTRCCAAFMWSPSNPR